MMPLTRFNAEAVGCHAFLRAAHAAGARMDLRLTTRLKTQSISSVRFHVRVEGARTPTTTVDLGAPERANPLVTIKGKRRLWKG